MTVSHVAWMSLAVVTDHLSAIRRHIEAKQLFPFSQLTLCRSALVGAAQAVWVLAPDTSHMRVRRARAVAAYLYKKQNQYLKDLWDLLDAPDKNTDAAAEFAAARFDELQAKRAADGQKQVDLDTTDMIRSAATEAFGSDDLTKNAVLAWRAGSGTAHGLMWPLFETRPCSKPDRLAMTVWPTFTLQEPSA